MLTITIGRENTAYPSISDQYDAEISEAVRSGKSKLFLVVNQAATYEAEGRLMDRLRVDGLMNHLGSEGLMDVEVISFKRLTARVFSLTGGAGKTVLDDHGRQMLIARCLAEHKNQLTQYKRSVGKAGFLAEITGMIGELKENDIAPETLSDVSEKDDVGALLRQKISDVEKIYTAYEETLGGSRFDEADRVSEAVEKIEAHRLFSGATFWIDGFFTFSVPERKLIEAIAAQAEDIHISLIADADPNVADAQVFAPCVRTLSELSDMAARIGCGLKINDITRQQGQQKGPTAFFADALYAYHDMAYPGRVGGVELHACMNTWDEAAAAAQTITVLVRDRGYRFGDIAVMVGDVGSSGGIISRVMKQYEIPCFTDQTDPVTDHPLIETVAAALRIAAGRVKREDVFAYLSAGFAPVTTYEAADLKNYAIALGVRFGEWFRPFERESESVDFDLDALNDARDRAMAPLKELKAVIGRKGNYRTYLTALFTFLEAIGAGETLTDMAERAEAVGFLEARLRTLQIWNILMKAIDQTESALGESPCDGGEFFSVFVGGLTSYRVGIIPENDDAVIIGDVLRSHAGRVRALFVLGVNEGVLPGSHRSFAVFSDRERQKLKSMGVPLKDDSAFLREREAYAIYRHFAGVSDFLFISYSSANDEGDALKPSVIAERVRTVLPNARVHSHVTGRSYDGTRWITPTAGTLNALADAASDGMSAVVEPVEKALAAEGIVYPKINTDRTDKLSPGIAASLYGAAPRISVSRVERFNACPFAYFADYGIRPQAIEPYEVSLPAIGNVVHNVLDLSFKRAVKRGTPPESLSEAEMRDLVESALTDVFDLPENRLFHVRDAFRYRGERVARTSRVSAEVLRQQLAEGDFAFYASELGFSENIEIPETAGAVHVSGKIDRVDTCETNDRLFLRIIDYKTGNKTISLTDIYYGLALQLLFYLSECTAMLSAQEVDQTVVPGGAFYFHADDPMVNAANSEDDEAAQREQFYRMNGVYLKDEDFKHAMSDSPASKVYSPRARDTQMCLEELNVLTAYVRQMIIRGAKEMTDGDVRVAPYEKAGGEMPCWYCVNKSLCGFDGLIDAERVRPIPSSVKKEDIMEAAQAQIGKGSGKEEEACHEMDE